MQPDRNSRAPRRQAAPRPSPNARDIDDHNLALHWLELRVQLARTRGERSVRVSIQLAQALLDDPRRPGAAAPARRPAAA